MYFLTLVVFPKLLFRLLKLKKYSLACQVHCACFNPLVFSIDGVLGKEAKFFLKRLAENLAVKWGRLFTP